MPRTELKCGCIPGYFLCTEAERLWARVIRLYRTYAPDEEIEPARQKYNDHLAGEEV